jgi:hypothetical protein
VSLFEPINVLMSRADPDLFSGYDVAKDHRNLPRLDH